MMILKQKASQASNLRSQKTEHSSLNGQHCYHDGFIQQTIAILSRQSELI